MGASAGPSLQGIGRGGDSNLVLEMDAHDAKSYPGEPTTNYAPIDLADWGTEATAVRTAAGYNFQGQPVYKCRTAVGASYQGIDKTITGLRTAASGGTVTMSIWVKNPNPSAYTFSSYMGHDFSSNRTLAANSDWQRIQWTVNESSMGNDYVEYRPYTNSAAIYIHMTMPQVEVLKGYATPFVREGNGGTGTYNARPASVNLMIHGDVGPDTVAGSNNPNVLSEAISKFETAVGWTVGQDWSINSGTEVAEITSWTQASFLQRAASPAEVIEGGRYVIKGDVTTSNAGTLYARVGNSSYAVLPTGTGSTVEVVCGNTATETVLFYSGGWEGTIDNVSVAPLAVMKDSSPSKHAITTVNDADHSNAQSKFSGGSIYFDGSDSLSMPDSADWNIGSADFTMDAWAYFDGFAVTLHNQSTVNATSNSAFIIWVGSAPNTAGIYLSDITGWDYYNVNSTSLSTGQWYHLAAVRSGDSLRMYVDGVSTSATSLPSAWTVGDSSRVLQIGEQDGNNYMNGYLDEVRFVKGTALWTSNFTPPTRRNLSAPVVDRVNYNGFNCTSTAVTDQATYRDGEVIRLTTPTDALNNIKSAVWDFDGTDDKLFGGVASFDPTGPATINLWLNQDSGNSGITTCLGNASASDRYFNIHPSNTSLMRMGVVSSGGWQYKTFTDNLLDRWAMLTIVNTGSSASPSTYSVYLNGTAHADNPVTYTGSFSDPTDLFVLGNYTLNNNYDTDGQIANVQIYKVALTPQQVKENFNQQRNRFKI